jgi:hypothetical protein
LTAPLTEATDDTSTGLQAPRAPSKLLLLLLSLAFSVFLFLALDWFHTARLHRNHKAGLPPDSCQTLDPVRHHVFKPNCTSSEYWGTDSFKVFTNSLGFRDEKIRDVPLTDPRPRILLLGDSHLEAKIAWRKSFAGMMAAQFPQYDFLNAGLSGYSPSNYFNTTRMLLDQGYQIDEVIVFLDNSAVQLEAGFYSDTDAAGDVAGIPQEQKKSAATTYARFRQWVGRHFSLTYSFLRQLDRVQRRFVLRGFYHLPGDYFGDPFDPEFSAWTYRKVDETSPFPAGYAPLGVEGGIAKAQAKMTQLYELLNQDNIPISVVVYPHLAQVVHDTSESRQMQMWRQWCEGKCKRFISVFPEFYAVRDKCSSSQAGCWYPALFVYGDMHYAAGGNALVADAVIASLAQDPPVKVGETAPSHRP